MLRTVVLVAVISAIAAPALARGGASDEQHERWAEQAKRQKETQQANEVASEPPARSASVG